MQSTHHRTLVELKLWQSFTDYALLARRHRHQFISTCICEDSKRIFDFAFIFRVIPILAPLSRTTLEHIMCHGCLVGSLSHCAIRLNSSSGVAARRSRDAGVKRGPCPRISTNQRNVGRAASLAPRRARQPRSASHTRATTRRLLPRFAVIVPRCHGSFLLSPSNV